MKTPDEIKSGLEYCTKPGCAGCPYDDQNLYCGEAKNKDALDYIKQLEARLVEANKTSEDLMAKLAECEKPLVPLTCEGKEPNWISVGERLPSEFVSILAHMTDAGEFPAVREAYAVCGMFFFPALHEHHPVDYWMEMPEPPEEDET